MDTKPVNPLFSHFRQPAIYFSLPSQGKYWPNGSIDIPVNGEIPVYPMTARDEITLRTPDALLNGQGVIDVIHSCCPSISDAWHMPSVDVDATLMAIRIASYGNEMSFDTRCPQCNEENTYSVELGNLLGTIKCPDYESTVQYKDIVIKLRPQEYFSVNSTNQINYEQQRILQALGVDGVPEETRLDEYKKHMQRILDLTAKILVDSTEYIKISGPDTLVTDKEYIEEFYQNCEAEVCRTVRSRLDQLNLDGAIPPMPTECQACQTPFTVPLTFDYANFFATGS